jgi:hypothetical protein
MTPQGGGTHRAIHVILTVLFNAFNDGEDSSQPRFNVGG